jgi:hypothetical protein
MKGDKKFENIHLSTQFFTPNLEKLFSEGETNIKVENFSHFEKGHLRTISYFSTGRKHLLRLKSRFS